MHLWLAFEKGLSVYSSGWQPIYCLILSIRHGVTSISFNTIAIFIAKFPRIRYGENKIAMVSVPWARPHSGFTLLFEAYSMLLIEEEMPVFCIKKLPK